MNPRLRTLLRQTLYSLATLPLGTAAFCILLTLLSAGAGLALLVVGIPVLALAAVAARHLAELQRTMISSLLDEEAPTPAYRSDLPDEQSAGLVQRIRTLLTDPQSWLDTGFGLLSMWLSLVTFTVVVSWWAAALAALAYPLYGWALPRGGGNQDLPELLGLGDSIWTAMVFNVLLGVLLAVTLRWVVAGATWLHATPALAMLSGRAGLQQQLVSVQEGRAAARQAQAGALRRLERDIHDGPQQQLVRLSMDLGRARQQLDADPDRARTILDDAIHRSGQTLDELRSLSRGIAPPVLVDRGLHAAISELAARATIPVHVRVDVPQLPEHVETTAYFVASEALTNVAKHAQATSAQVQVGMVPGMTGPDLLVRVSDDGVGGAHEGKGSGLAGLADRLRSVDGALTVSSPEGGPTVVEGRMPCA